MSRVSFVLDTQTQYHQSSNEDLFGELERADPIKISTATAYRGSICLSFNGVIYREKAYYVSDLQVENVLSLRQLMKSEFEVVEHTSNHITLSNNFSEITAHMVDGKYQLETMVLIK